MKKLWFVEWGVDASHMWEVKCFALKRDAESFAAGLPPREDGGAYVWRVVGQWHGEWN